MNSGFCYISYCFSIRSLYFQTMNCKCSVMNFWPLRGSGPCLGQKRNTGPYISWAVGINLSQQRYFKIKIFLSPYISISAVKYMMTHTSACMKHVDCSKWNCHKLFRHRKMNNWKHHQGMSLIKIWITQKTFIEFFYIQHNTMKSNSMYNIYVEMYSESCL